MSKKQFGVNIGSSSILMIFVILCLVSFASLSYISARVDYNLSNKINHRTKDYYQACNKASSTIAIIDTNLKKLYQDGISKDEYFNAYGNDFQFSVPFSENQNLDVSITIHYPLKKTDTFLEINSWKVVTLDESESTNSLPVFQP